MLKLYRLLKWLYNNIEITEYGSLCINTRGSLVQLGKHGIKIISDNPIQINGSKLYLQCSSDYLYEQLEQNKSMSDNSDTSSTNINSLPTTKTSVE